MHRRNANDRVQTAFHIIFCRRPGRDADAHRRASLPHRSPTPAGSVGLNRFDDAPGRRIIAERDQYLVEYDVVRVFRIRRRAALRRSAPRGGSISRSNRPTPLFPESEAPPRPRGRAPAGTCRACIGSARVRLRRSDKPRRRSSPRADVRPHARIRSRCRKAR